VPVVYEPVLFVHVVAAAVLVGTMLVEILAGAQLRRAADLRGVRTWVGFVRPLTAVSGAAWLLLLMSGGHLAGVRWSFGDGWITVSAVGLLIAAAVGPLVHGRRLKAIGAAAGADGPVPGDLRAAITDPVLWASVHAQIGVGIGFIYAMTNKTGFLGTALALLLPAVAGALAGVLLARSVARTDVTGSPATR
jgi:hypothetical protein